MPLQITITMHPQFKTLNNEQKNQVIQFANRLLKHDSFFIEMNKSKGKELTLLSAIDTATNKFLKQSFHNKFGFRQL